MARKKQEDNKFIYFILIIFILFVFIIIAEVIIVKKYINRDKSYETSLFNSKQINKDYDVSKIEYTEVELGNDIVIRDICDDICNIKVNGYYFLFNKRNNIYTLSVIYDNKVLVDKDLGSTLDGAFINTYENNIYLYNVINTDTFLYDYLLIFNGNKVDEFVSLEANEMEITEEGIIYYYDSCYKHDGGNAYKVKAIRRPFTNQGRELDKVNKNYSWCAN